MEFIIDAMKKRAWRSVWLSLKALIKGACLGMFNAFKGVMKTMAVLFLFGWAFGFGGYYGLSAAFHVGSHVGNTQAVFIDLMPVQIIDDRANEQ